MIINIRGTSGSGKSSVVRQMMKYAVSKTELKGADGKVMGYECRYVDIKPIRFIGRYETACGGCDTVKTQDEVEQRVRDWHSENFHVVFEGLLISTIYTRWAQLARECQPFHFVFLDAPLELCIFRVKERRRTAGNDKEFNVANTSAKWTTIRGVCQKLTASGLSCLSMPSETAAELILRRME